MRRYLDNALLIDIAIVVLLGLCLYFFKSFLNSNAITPQRESLNIFIVSLITVSATLIGFLLTIITVIITFKKGFEEKKKDPDNNLGTVIPDKTIFEEKTTNNMKFYGTPLHKKVIRVFMNATYEISVVTFFLLTLQFNLETFPSSWISIFACCLFTLLVLSIARSLYIFHLFLNVHLGDNK